MLERYTTAQKSQSRSYFPEAKIYIFCFAKIFASPSILACGQSTSVWLHCCQQLHIAVHLGKPTDQLQQQITSSYVVRRNQLSFSSMSLKVLPQIRSLQLHSLGNQSAPLINSIEPNTHNQPSDQIHSPSL